MTKKQKTLLFIVLFLAISFRFWLIWQMPGGLFPDEAANGLDINSMQVGQLQPFYERGNGREALFFYMLWGSVEIFGKGPWQHHIVSALVGVLAVLTCFLLTKKLFLPHNYETLTDQEKEVKSKKGFEIAIVSAFLMAVSSWHVTLSRTAFRANLIPLFSSLTLFLLLVSYHSNSLKNKLLFSFLTGASFALGFYTYIAYRIMIPIVLTIVIWPLIAQIRFGEFWKTLFSYKKQICLFFIAFLIFIYPLAHYFYTHPGSFVGRSGQVSIFNQELYGELGIKEKFASPPPLDAVLKAAGIVAKKSFEAYFVNGDLNWRHNVSGQAFLSEIVSPFFAIGLLFSIFYAIGYLIFPNKNKDWWKFFLLVISFFGMLIPVVATAEGIPHGLRSIGTIPFVFIISAWGVVKFKDFLVNFYRNHSSYNSELGKTLVTFSFKVLVVCFFSAIVLQTYSLYFVYAYNDANNFFYFRSDLTEVSSYLKNRCAKNNTFLVLDKFSVQTTDYLTSDEKGNFDSPCNVPYKQVDPEDSWKLTNINSEDEIIFTQSSIFDTKKFKDYHPSSYMTKELKNKFGEVIMQVYKIK